jgi:hypothetical protein
MRPHPILHFWFNELSPKQHFAKDPALDETICTGSSESALMTRGQVREPRSSF